MKKLENRLRNKLVEMLDELEDIGEEGKYPTTTSMQYSINQRPISKPV